MDSTEPRSRRALLLGGLGAALASVAALVRAPVARAGDDGDLVLEATNNASAQTELIATTGSAGLRVLSDGIGLQGWGTIGVDAYGSSIGVNAVSDGSAAPAGVGYNRMNSVGQLGWSTDGNESTPTLPPKTGVLGIAEQDSDARGVFGRTTSGQGVRGEATTGVGVQAVATTGVALAVSGRTTLSRSGRAAVPANASHVDVTVPGGLTASATVLATLQSYRAGVYLAGVRTNYPSAGKFRAYLNTVGSTTWTTPVAWLVIG